MIGGLPIAVVIIVMLILAAALYIFLNTPSIFEGKWVVTAYDGPLGENYSGLLNEVTFSLAEDNEHIIVHPATDIEPIVFRITTMEPSHIIAESNQEQDNLGLEFKVEDPNTNEVSLILTISTPKEIKAKLYYESGQ